MEVAAGGPAGKRSWRAAAPDAVATPLAPPAAGLGHRGRPVRTHERVEYFVSRFSGADEADLRGRARAADALRADDPREAPRRGLPEDMIFLPLIESWYDPHAYSRAAAVGMWQFMTDDGEGRRDAGGLVGGRAARSGARDRRRGGVPRSNCARPSGRSISRPRPTTAARGASRAGSRSTRVRAPGQRRARTSSSRSRRSGKRCAPRRATTCRSSSRRRSSGRIRRATRDDRAGRALRVGFGAVPPATPLAAVAQGARGPARHRARLQPARAPRHDAPDRCATVWLRVPARHDRGLPRAVRGDPRGRARRREARGDQGRATSSRGSRARTGSRRSSSTCTTRRRRG
jgi:hypothetical protein